MFVWFFKALKPEPSERQVKGALRFCSGQALVFFRCPNPAQGRMRLEKERRELETVLAKAWGWTFFVSFSLASKEKELPSVI